MLASQIVLAAWSPHLLRAWASDWRTGIVVMPVPPPSAISTGTMALVMFAFMRSMMYKNRAYNLVLVAVALLLGAGGLYLSRSQVLVDDQAYMKGMIPHHSIAILTSERADIDDVRVRELADGIIKAQRKEIKEMDWLIEDIEKNGPATTQEEADQRPVPSFEGTAAGNSKDVSDALAMLALFGVEAP
jgi:hypothetical protein